MESGESHIELARALAGSFTVYLPDRRGRGLSGPFGPGYSLREEVEDVAALLDATGSHDIFGVSSGGIIALQAALTLAAVERVAVFEPALSVDGSAPTAFLARFDRQIAAGQTAPALVTAMKAAEMGPPIFNAVPRGLLELLTRAMMGAEDRKASAERRHDAQAGPDAALRLPAGRRDAGRRRDVRRDPAGRAPARWDEEPGVPDQGRRRRSSGSCRRPGASSWPASATVRRATGTGAAVPSWSPQSCSASSPDPVTKVRGMKIMAIDPSASSIILTHDLRKTFKGRAGAVEAVKGVDLDVKAGEIFGFLGPNGAGKTTTLRMLTTLHPADLGRGHGGRRRPASRPGSRPPADRLRRPGRGQRPADDRPRRARDPGPPVRHEPGAGRGPGDRGPDRARPDRGRRAGRPAPTRAGCAVASTSGWA